MTDTQGMRRTRPGTGTVLCLCVSAVATKCRDSVADSITHLLSWRSESSAEHQAEKLSEGTGEDAQAGLGHTEPGVLEMWAR